MWWARPTAAGTRFDYPFGSHLFSNLVHYVRCGDFVEALIRDSQNINEYAFALGALAHHGSDNLGHPIAVNRAVPLIFKIVPKFGPLKPLACERASWH